MSPRKIREPKTKNISPSPFIQRNFASPAKNNEARSKNFSPVPTFSHSHICQDTEKQIPEVLRKIPLQDAKVQNPAFGKVPAYLSGVKKRLEFDRQEKIRAEEKAKLPLGMRLLTEDERIDTLH